MEAAIDSCRSTGEPLRVRYRVTRPRDGVGRWFDAQGQALYEDGAIVRLVGAVADVTEVTEQVLAEAEARATQAFEHAVMLASPDIIFVYDLLVGSVVWTSRSLTELLGYATDELAQAGDLIAQLMPPDDRVQFDAALQSARHTRDAEITQLSHRLTKADGTVCWFAQRTSPLSRDASGRVTQLVGALRDITESTALEKRLEFYSLHDRLTELPNRALLVDRLEVALARSRRDGREVAVLFCDLDGFKRVNDNAGHAAGDVVFTEIARRLQSVLRVEDTVARVGGDEFVIVVEPWDRPGTTRAGAQPVASVRSDRAMALVVADRVAEVLRAPISVNDVDHVISASIGITYSDWAVDPGGRTITADEVLENADAAMYEAKRRGKARFEVFERGMRADLAERGRVEHVLRAALLAYHADTASDRGPDRAGRRAFSAAYQPILDARTSRLVGFEALARLTDPAGVAIAPDTFIVVAEDTGLIHDLGGVMLELACGQLARWRATEPAMADVTMAVNISAMQAQHSSLAEDVLRTLTDHQLLATDLVLELTETALLQAAHATLINLRSLHDQGVGIAIDDFGTGYASLRYLATLPVSAVKVDRSFTAGIEHDQTCRKIVYAVAGLAADMGLTCVVEGVETGPQRAALPPDVQIQGWLTGRAEQPSDLDLPALLRPAEP